MPRIEREAGRKLFGVDPAAYDQGRPGHPARVYELLVERCGLGPGVRVLEIGPGTGQATRRLLELGADVVAIEPDPRLADLIQSTLDGVDVLQHPFEDAVVAAGAFDLVVAASSFHWVDETVGLAKAWKALRPGGSIGLWWTLFGVDDRPSPFQDALRTRLAELYRARGVAQEESPSAAASPGRPRHGLDVAARTAAFEASRFEDVFHELIPWTHRWDTAGIRALYASFSPIIRLDDETRAAALDAVCDLADGEFGGRVELPLLTSCYTGRRSTVAD